VCGARAIPTGPCDDDDDGRQEDKTAKHPEATQAKHRRLSLADLDSSCGDDELPCSNLHLDDLIPDTAAPAGRGSTAAASSSWSRPAQLDPQLPSGSRTVARVASNLARSLRRARARIEQVEDALVNVAGHSNKKRLRFGEMYAMPGQNGTNSKRHITPKHCHTMFSDHNYQHLH
jgi:hypothetical protein